MESFTPFPSLAGGVLIGLAASALLLLDGKIAGISGIVGGLARPSAGDLSWRIAFVAGLMAGGGLLRAASPGAFAITVAEPLPILVAGGLLVGFGTRLGPAITSLVGGRLEPVIFVAAMVTGMALHRLLPEATRYEPQDAPARTAEPAAGAPVRATAAAGDP